MGECDLIVVALVSSFRLSVVQNFFIVVLSMLGNKPMSV